MYHGNRHKKICAASLLDDHKYYIDDKIICTVTQFHEEITPTVAEISGKEILTLKYI